MFGSLDGDLFFDFSDVASDLSVVSCDLLLGLLYSTYLAFSVLDLMTYLGGFLITFFLGGTLLM